MTAEPLERGRANASRTVKDLKAVGTQADRLYYLLRYQGIDAAAGLTCAWSRRLLLDVTLEMTRRHLEILHPPRRKAPVGNFRESDRIKAEEARWTDDAARAARTRYQNGSRDPYDVEGRRVYQRRQRRANALRLMAAIQEGQGHD